MTFGSLLQLHLKPNRAWLTLGPGWLVIISALTGGLPHNSLDGARLIALWLLVDPIFGTLWGLLIEQPFWRPIAPLPVLVTTGFTIPYAQVGSWAGHLVIEVRRYQAWWRTDPTLRAHGLTLGGCLGLAIFISYQLSPVIFGLTMLAIGLILLLGLQPPLPMSLNGGRLQATWQGLIPWAMGSALFVPMTPLSWSLSMAVWAIYLGGLRWGSQARWAAWLFFGGQITAIMVLLAVRGLPGATLAGVLLFAQYGLYQQYPLVEFRQRVQLYLFLNLWVIGGTVAWFGS